MRAALLLTSEGSMDWQEDWGACPSEGPREVLTEEKEVYSPTGVSNAIPEGVSHSGARGGSPRSMHYISNFHL